MMMIINFICTTVQNSDQNTGSLRGTNIWWQNWFERSEWWPHMGTALKRVASSCHSSARHAHAPDRCRSGLSILNAKSPNISLRFHRLFCSSPRCARVRLEFFTNPRCYTSDEGFRDLVFACNSLYIFLRIMVGVLLPSTAKNKL